MRRQLIRLAIVAMALAAVAVAVPVSAGWVCSTSFYCNIGGCGFNSNAGYKIKTCVNTDTGQSTTSSTFVGCGC